MTLLAKSNSSDVPQVCGRPQKLSYDIATLNCYIVLHLSRLIGRWNLINVNG